MWAVGRGEREPGLEGAGGRGKEGVRALGVGWLVWESARRWDSV